MKKYILMIAILTHAGTAGFATPTEQIFSKDLEFSPQSERAEGNGTQLAHEDLHYPKRLGKKDRG